MSLCVCGGAMLLTLAGTSFTLSWTHSVEKTGWRERWSIVDDTLVLEEAAVQGSGAGMDPGPDARLVDGWWVWTPSLAPVPRLVLSRSGTTVSPWTLCAQGRCIVLDETDDAPATLTVCHPSRG